MGRNCGPGNTIVDRRLHSCVLRRRRGGGRVKNSPGLPTLRISFEMSQISEKGSLKSEIMYVAIQQLSLYLRVIIMNENSTLKIHNAQTSR